MNRLLLQLSVLLLLSCSKYTKLNGTYFSAKQDALILDENIGMMESGTGYPGQTISLKQNRRKLKFREVSYASTLIFKKRIRRFDFRILYNREDSFMLSPSSHLSKTFFNNRDSIVFKDKYQFVDQTNYFTKIIYHSGRCFGYCHDLHLELDNSGNLKVTDNGNGLTDTLVNKNYFAKVSFDDLARLITVLKYAQLKTLQWPAFRKCFDFPDLTLIIYQNEKRYYFKMNGACLPVVSYELNRFLQNLFKYPVLKSTTTTFEYER